MCAICTYCHDGAVAVLGGQISYHDENRHRMSFSSFYESETTSTYRKCASIKL
jgi:hypothetical protein